MAKQERNTTQEEGWDVAELTPDRLRELRRIAEAATPGPWDTTRYNGGLRFDGPLRVYAGTDPEFGEPKPIPATEEDTRYIAAFDPPTVLALLNEIDRLRRERETLAAAVMAWEEYRNAALGSIAEVEAVAKLREAHTKALALLEGGDGA